MKITKLVHSCLIIEHDDKKILVDPGNYSWQSGLVKPELLVGMDAVVVTHEHADHLHEEFVKAVLAGSPDAEWYGTSQVIAKLADWGIEGSSNSSDSTIKFIESEHADLSPWFSEQPEHTSFVLFDDILIGGDCHTLKSNYGARIFAGAINGGPWGAVVGFSKMIESMEGRTEVVVPLHDWHWSDEARQGIYARLPEVMGSQGIKFIPLDNGVSVEV